MSVRELRVARGWSQAELAERTGLSIRTVQRIEQGGQAGLDSLRRLAAALQVDVAALQPPDAPAADSPARLVRHALEHYGDLQGTTGRAEYWWFTLAVALAVAAGSQIGPWLGGLVGIVVLVPWVTAGVRRLRDAGQSPWWLLLLLVPVGGPVALLFLLVMPSQADAALPDGPGA